MEEILFTIHEFSEIIKSSERSVRSMVRSGQIKAIRLPNGRIRILASEIQRLFGEDKADDIINFSALKKQKKEAFDRLRSLGVF